MSLYLTNLSYSFNLVGIGLFNKSQALELILFSRRRREHSGLSPKVLSSTLPGLLPTRRRDGCLITVLS